MDQNDIRKAFYKYDVNLFKSKPVEREKIKAYLTTKTILTKIKRETKQMLNQEIATEEIFEAISELKLGKITGD